VSHVWKRPLPVVGDLIREDWGEEGHPGTWAAPAEVKAVIDEYMIVCKFSVGTPGKPAHSYKMFSRWQWEWPEMKHLTGAKTERERVPRNEEKPT
jgi:hypothetical protein